MHDACAAHLSAAAHAAASVAETDNAVWRLTAP